MGTDSFTPDHGVMLAKTKNADASPFVWVIDANPQDIKMVDFTRPDGTKAMVTLADYRQLSDALFHAGANSGSEYEYVDKPNRLHFYVLDLERDADGILSYTVAIKSLDGDGPHKRGVQVEDVGAATVGGGSLDLLLPGEEHRKGEGRVRIAAARPSALSRHVGPAGLSLSYPAGLVVSDDRLAQWADRVAAGAGGRLLEVELVAADLATGLDADVVTVLDQRGVGGVVVCRLLELLHGGLLDLVGEPELREPGPEAFHPGLAARAHRCCRRSRAARAVRAATGSSSV